MTASASDIRIWCEWVVNQVWESDDNANMGLAERMFAREKDAIRRAAAWAYSTFPHPDLLAPPKLYHGFRSASPNLKVRRPHEWTDRAGTVLGVRSWSEMGEVACIFAWDSQALAEFLDRVKAAYPGTKRADVGYDQTTLAPVAGQWPDGTEESPLQEPWGHGHVAVVGKNLSTRALLFHWRYAFEHPSLAQELLDRSLRPRQPSALVENHMLYLGQIAQFEYLLDMEAVGTVNVTGYSFCQKDRLFRVKAQQWAQRTAGLVMQGTMPAPSPAFPNAHLTHRRKP